MHLLHLAATIATLCTTALLALSGELTPGLAAARHLSDNVARTLPEASNDGPALSCLASSGATETAIAWTGTDAAHHINLATITV